jgi:hypothetical protein
LEGKILSHVKEHTTNFIIYDGVSYGIREKNVMLIGMSDLLKANFLTLYISIDLSWPHG